MNEAQKQVASIQANAHKFKNSSQPVKNNNNHRALASIDEIFARLKANCSVGSAFKTAQDEYIVKQEWMLALREEGITKQSMIEAGIYAFRVKSRQSSETTWFPQIGEFIGMCRGNKNANEYAERALKLFNRDERQICNVGQILVCMHKFELKRLPAHESNKTFMRMYLELSKETEIKILESTGITETVELSPDQQKAAKKRNDIARNECLNSLHSLFGQSENKIKASKKVSQLTKGVNIGSLKHCEQSISDAEKEKSRQLKMIKQIKNKTAFG